jgi:hypothetical protein
LILIEVDKAESQTMLNTLTEHDFQDVFKNGRVARNGIYAQERTTLMVIVVSMDESVYHKLQLVCL